MLLAPDWDEVDDALFAAASTGADRWLRLKPNLRRLYNHALARIFKPIIGQKNLI